MSKFLVLVSLFVSQVSFASDYSLNDVVGKWIAIHNRIAVEINVKADGTWNVNRLTKSADGNSYEPTEIAKGGGAAIEEYVMHVPNIGSFRSPVLDLNTDRTYVIMQNESGIMLLSQSKNPKSPTLLFFRDTNTDRRE